MTRHAADSNPRCDVIIPALNEASNIDALFEALEPMRARGMIRHVVLADNGSTDDTPRLAEARGAKVVTEPARGYGGACLKAIEWLKSCDQTPQTIVFLDADLSDDPAALRDLLAPIARGEAEVTIGSRIKRAEPGALNIVQRFGNGLACFLMRVFSGRRYSDLGPFRAVSWETLLRLDMRDRTWGWTVELQMKAALLGIAVVEVDVPYRRRASGRSKVSGSFRGIVTAGMKIIMTIFVLWLQRKRLRRDAGGAPQR